MKRGFIVEAKVSHISNKSFEFVTIPHEYLTKLGLESGDPVEIRVYKDRITIRKTKGYRNRT